MTIGLIICGALGREVLDIIAKNGWDAEVIGIPAVNHLYPDRIAPDVEKQILNLKEKYERLVVVYGDCGSKGALDKVLEEHGIERVEGPHCYEMYAGELFFDLMEEELGTFFLTDYLIKAFRGSMIKGMGLDRFPQLKKEYFRNYTRLVYLVQNGTLANREKAGEIAAYLELPLEIQETGYGLLEQRLKMLID
ncbi:MAG: DUF1638 domain-containing protein [Anaerolineales bacterium]|jgi:hypothetical protein